MARKKEYNENEVVEKAMQQFWRNGYETTSMQMLEKEMGINKFSIYASFGNKHGLFIESLKCYKLKVSVILEKFKNATNSVADIKQFFYDFVAANFKGSTQKGCFITNT
jgi:TetR/AcrR family transcriptional repressor of nem operon